VSIIVQLGGLHTEVGLAYGTLVKKAIMTTVLPLIDIRDEWKPTIGRPMVAISVTKSMAVTAFSHGISVYLAAWPWKESHIDSGIVQDRVNHPTGGYWGIIDSLN
jgi:hypothetical protein